MAVPDTTLALLFGSLVAAAGALGGGADDAPKTVPTRLEILATQTSTPAPFERRIGVLETPVATVVVTALVLAEQGAENGILRGVRLDFSARGSTSQVFLEEAQVRAASHDLDRVESAIERLERDDSSPYRVHGTERCWMPSVPLRVLCPSYRIGPDWAGMTAGAYGGPTFEFPDQRPAQLRRLIEQAIASLPAQ